MIKVKYHTMISELVNLKCLAKRKLSHIVIHHGSMIALIFLMLIYRRMKIYHYGNTKDFIFPEEDKSFNCDIHST